MDLKNNMEKLTKEISTELTLSDMKVINNIIDLVSSKGLIRAADFTLVGSIYEKINALLKTNESHSNQ